jgi:hypothetical protein
MLEGYSSTLVTWYVLQSISILLLAWLAVQFLWKGKHKTFACLCVMTILDCGASVALSIVHGDGLATLQVARAPECVAQAYTLYFTRLSWAAWACCLMWTLWLLIVRAANQVEMKWFKVRCF